MDNWGSAELVKPSKPRLIYRSWGEEKTGKDHFGLTMPGPYVKHQFDPGGLEGVADKFLDQKEMRIFGYKRLAKRKFKDKDSALIAWNEAKRQRDEFIENLEISLRLARSISIDESEAWELFRFAEFGNPSNAPKNYELLNDDYRDVIQMAVDARINLQLVQKLKNEWGNYDDYNADGKKIKKPYQTGNRIPTGYGELQYIVQANIQHVWTKERGFWITVVNCRQNMAVGGKEYEGAEFSDLATEIFPQTGVENWI